MCLNKEEITKNLNENIDNISVECYDFNFEDDEEFDLKYCSNQLIFKNQKPFPRKFLEILNDNFWDLV